MFERGSRYERVPDAVWTDRIGRQISYKRLRILTTPPSVRTHRVGPEDRLDLIAHRYLGVPEQYWRVVDANEGMLPPELVGEVGRRLRIPHNGV